jgi:hypothetical protein
MSTQGDVGTPSQITPGEASRIKSRLMNAPVAPAGLSYVINVGTDDMLDVLERQYFESELPDGISSFKYLEGDYGTGKTQFIQCLAERAHRHHVVTALVTIDEHSPFSSPLAILKSVLSSFVPGEDTTDATAKGIEVLLRWWIRHELAQMGVSPGDSVPDQVRQQILRPFVGIWAGAPDTQMASGLQALGQRLVAIECGAAPSTTDAELIAWARGERVTSANLRTRGLYAAASDATGFARLKTTIQFLRTYLAYRGVFVAFDEGTRTGSFRTGSQKQRQAVENMLSLINQNAEGEFGGAMFVYAATPDFRTDVIQNYRALADRIGSVAFVPGQPMTPLIKLDQVNSDAVLRALGERLVEVFMVAGSVSWSADSQKANAEVLLAAVKKERGFLSSVPPRSFVFHWCRFLDAQLNGGEQKLDTKRAEAFVRANAEPEEL